MECSGHITRRRNREEARRCRPRTWAEPRRFRLSGHPRAPLMVRRRGADDRGRCTPGRSRGEICSIDVARPRRRPRLWARGGRPHPAGFSGGLRTHPGASGLAVVGATGGATAGGSAAHDAASVGPAAECPATFPAVSPGTHTRSAPAGSAQALARPSGPRACAWRAAGDLWGARFPAATGGAACGPLEPAPRGVAHGAPPGDSASTPAPRAPRGTSRGA